MIQVQEVILITKNVRDKIQTARYVLEQSGNTYTIKRFTGQFGGKITQQPDKIIEKGKAKRSVLQQAELEYNSLVKKALDKGYKRYSELTKIKFETIGEVAINSLISSVKSDANGNMKPQQAKSYKDCSTNVWDKPRFASRKLNGVRCMFKWDKENDCVITVSRGGGDYDASTTHLRLNDEMVLYLRNNPDIILDGELYKHGWPLQRISGTARLKEWEERCGNLEYWIYDIADVNEHFTVRLDSLVNLELYFEDTPKINVLEHKLVEGWVNNKKLHDKWVSEGYEGLVSRASNKCYKAASRTTDWIKLKIYEDAEFKIIGVSEGLRAEDMCFILETESGKEFKAKPMGTREEREEYFENSDAYIGKMGTVAYFELSEDGIPSGNTVFKSVREDGE